MALQQITAKDTLSEGVGLIPNQGLRVTPLIFAWISLILTIRDTALWQPLQSDLLAQVLLLQCVWFIYLVHHILESNHWYVFPPVYVYIHTHTHTHTHTRTHTHTHTHTHTQSKYLSPSALWSSIPLKILEESEHNSTASSISLRGDILFKESEERRHSWLLLSWCDNFAEFC